MGHSKCRVQAELYDGSRVGALFKCRGEAPEAESFCPFSCKSGAKS